MSKKIIVVGIIAVTAMATVVAVTLFLPASFPYHRSEVVEFKIEKGYGLSEIANSLKNENIIKSKLVFRGYVLLTGQAHKLQAGRYQIEPNISIADLASLLSDGHTVPDDIQVTIPEGSNINDVDKILSKSGLIRSGDLLKQQFLELEGRIFPDTYRFTKQEEGSSGNEIVSDIIKKMRDNFNKKTKDVYGGRNLSPGDIQRSVIIASILEKEVRTPQDMEIVAGIIEKRISLKMPLQIDATVAYGVCYSSFLEGKNCETSQVNLIKAIKEAGQFNSYKNLGLPPKPISNPGEVAIYSALHPRTSDYLYYLTDRKTGNTIFSRTAKEHEANRAIYIQ